MDNDEPRHATHVPDEVLAYYAAGQLTEADEIAVDEHLADCQPCSAIVRSALLVGDAWDTWNAHAHGQVYLLSRLAQAVASARSVTTDAGWQTRLTIWAERFAGRAEAAVRVVVDAGSGASHVVTEGLEALSRVGSTWQFAAIPVATPTRGPRSSAPGLPTVALATGVAQVARVAVGGARREVVVRLDAPQVGSVQPLVLLVPVSGDAEPRIVALEPQPGVAYLVARFTDLPVGEYVVAFEPSPNQ
jgi:hypothetical protein